MPGWGADVPFDVKALLHNKPALIGVGVAAAAGLYVLVKRKQTTGSTAAGASTAGGGTAYGVPSSYPDTSTTDLVQQLGQFNQELQTELAQYQQQLAANQPTSGTGAIIPQWPTGSVVSAPPGAGRARGTIPASGPVRIMRPLNIF